MNKYKTKFENIDDFNSFIIVWLIDYREETGKYFLIFDDLAIILIISYRKNTFFNQKFDKHKRWTP